jgi:hypothetical protein
VLLRWPRQTRPLGAAGPGMSKHPPYHHPELLLTRLGCLKRPLVRTLLQPTRRATSVRVCLLVAHVIKKTVGRLDGWPVSNGSRLRSHKRDEPSSIVPKVFIRLPQDSTPTHRSSRARHIAATNRERLTPSTSICGMTLKLNTRSDGSHRERAARYSMLSDPR